MKKGSNGGIPILTVAGMTCMGVGAFMVLAEQQRACSDVLQSVWGVMPYIVGAGLVVLGSGFLMPYETLTLLDHVANIVRRRGTSHHEHTPDE